MRSVYYFATPRKSSGDATAISSITLMLRAISAGCVRWRVRPIWSTPSCRRISPSPTSHLLSVLQSIAVTETPRELAEYAIAKRAGEDLCAFYNRYAKGIKIIVERLPRTKTDQTSTLLPLPAESALEIMLPIVQRMESDSSR